MSTLTPYRPRRASSRWLDGDCPKGVLAIYDNGGMDKRNGSGDRYTVFYAEPIPGPNGWWIGYRGMSERPSAPYGIGIYGELEAHKVAAYRYRSSHQACKWTSLPAEVQDVVRRDLESVES
jgi:hypothetical protein